LDSISRQNLLAQQNGNDSNEGGRERQADRQRDIDRERERERETKRQRQIDRDRDRQIETDGQRQSEKFCFVVCGLFVGFGVWFRFVLLLERCRSICFGLKSLNRWKNVIFLKLTTKQKHINSSKLKQRHTRNSPNQTKPK